MNGIELVDSAEEELCRYEEQGKTVVFVAVDGKQWYKSLGFCLIKSLVKTMMCHVVGFVTQEGYSYYTHAIVWSIIITHKCFALRCSLPSLACVNNCSVSYKPLYLNHRTIS